MRRSSQQDGYIYRRGGWWVLRYREDVLEAGELVRRQFARRIEPVRPAAIAPGPNGTDGTLFAGVSQPTSTA